jgi:hypothetical protein
MGFLDKVKQSAEQATAKAKEGVSTVQTKRELGQAYTELGETAFRVADSGAISHPELDPIVERIRSLKTQLDDAGAADGAGDEAETGVQVEAEEQTVGTGESTT